MQHNYSLEELEKQYSPSQWCINYDSEGAMNFYMKFSEKESKAVTETFPDLLQLSFGETEEQKLDIFGDKSLPKDSPIFLFLHGGYWIFGNRETSRFVVSPFYRSNIVPAVMGYDLISENVSLPDMILQVQKGIATLLKYAEERGSKGVYICGHSAGAHLVCAALSLEKLENVNYDIIKAVIPISGLFDLNALLPTTNATNARITKEIAEKCSPLSVATSLKRNLAPKTRVLVIVANKESDAFIQQSEVYAMALKNIDMNCGKMLVMNTDHIEIITNLAKESDILTRRLLDLMLSE